MLGNVFRWMLGLPYPPARQPKLPQPTKRVKGKLVNCYPDKLFAGECTATKRARSDNLILQATMEDLDRKLARDGEAYTRRCLEEQ